MNLAPQRISQGPPGPVGAYFALWPLDSTPASAPCALRLNSLNGIPSFLSHSDSERAQDTVMTTEVVRLS